MRDHAMRRALAFVATIVSALVLVVSGGGWAALTYSSGRIHRNDVFKGLNEQDRPTKNPATGDAVTYLIVGSDNREGLTPQQIKKLHVGRATADNGSGQRSDTMLLLHISADRDRAIVVSLPRDSYVTIPPHESNGEQVGVTHNKLNAAFAFGGAPLLVRTVEQNTNVRIDHYVEVNFNGFVDMVDALNGVNVCVRQPIKDQKAGLDLQPGLQHMDGIEALKYVRARYFDGKGDIGRMRRQQAFIGAMFQEATSAGVLFNPVKLLSFVNAALDAVDADPGLSRSDVVDLAQQLRNVSANRIVFATVPIANEDYRPGGVGSAVLWDETLSKRLFSDIENDRPINSPTPTPSPSATPAVVAEVPPSEISVKLLNAAGTSGLATRAADDFRAAGFRIVGSPGNADTTGMTTTEVRYDPRWSRSVKTLQAALPDATFTQVDGLGGTFQVLLGSDYSGLKPVTVASAAPTPSASGTSTPGGTIETHTAAEEKSCSVG
ncbi:MAG: LCP family protein [Actinomycetales bacterium]